MIKIYVWLNSRTKSLVIKYSVRVVDIDIGSVNGYGHELLQIIYPVISPNSFLKRLKIYFNSLWSKYKYNRKIKKRFREEYKKNISYYRKK